MGPYRESAGEAGGAHAATAGCSAAAGLLPLVALVTLLAEMKEIILLRALQSEGRGEEGAGSLAGGGGSGPLCGTPSPPPAGNATNQLECIAAASRN